MQHTWPYSKNKIKTKAKISYVAVLVREQFWKKNVCQKSAGVKKTALEDCLIASSTLWFTAIIETAWSVQGLQDFQTFRQLKNWEWAYQTWDAQTPVFPSRAMLQAAQKFNSCVEVKYHNSRVVWPCTLLYYRTSFPGKFICISHESRLTSHNPDCNMCRNIHTSITHLHVG